VFDYAEAFTVIDVNTGRFVGSRSKSSGGRLEDTITANNLEAVKEVVHQLRLRDIGGIIVIDFIDMANPKNRATVEGALKTELERDRTKTYVVEISPLGLVEMTRQNVTDGPREILTQKCTTCGGDGIVLSAHSAAIDTERKLRDLARNSKRGVEAYRIELEEGVAAHLIGPGAVRLTEIETLAKRRFFLEGNAGVPLDHFKVRKEGKLADIAPQSPVEEGSEIRLELVEVGEHDMGAGVGKLDGLSICVADAAQLVGKKAKVRVERVLDGMGYATLVQPASKAGDVPITAESEAEKPTRAPRKKKVEEAAPKPEPAADEPAAEEPVAEEPAAEEPAAEEPVAEEPKAVETIEEGAPKPKKKTRRGSRGGRNRRKKPAAAAVAENGKPEKAEAPAPAAANGQPEETVAPAPAAATIHVPSPDLGQAADDDGAPADGEQPPKKKRTRRGSRGGRNRRKKPASASQAAPSSDEPA
jgi:ribonuclease G